MNKLNGAEYLGTHINAKAHPAQGISRTIIFARSAETKLKIFWREGRVSKRCRIQMFNAIAGTKLTYGLEILPISSALQKKLDPY